MTPAETPLASPPGPSFKSAILGFLISNVALTTLMVLLGSAGA